MKSKMMLSLMPVFLAVFVLVGAKQAQAVDVRIGIGTGGSHYYRGSNVIQYRTADPVYSTWYPETTTSYVYTPRYYSSPTYYDNGYGYGYTAPTTYVYSSNSTGYNSWYGSGRSGNGGYYYNSRNNTRDGGRRR